MLNHKYKASDLITMVGLLAIIYGFGIATLVVPDKEFSEDENRYLQQKPKFTIQNLVDGIYTAEIADYFSDQIPLRDLFVGTKAVIEIAMLKSENNDVLLGSDGYIIAKQDYPSYDECDKNLKAVNRFAEALAADETLDVRLDVAIAGRPQDVLVKYVPALYPAEEYAERDFNHAASLLETSSIDLLTPLRAHADAGEYVYYKTDHHWTSLGAYYAYVELMTSWGLTPYPLDYFTRETVSEDFYGTTWSKAGMKWVGPDTIEFFRYPGDDTLITEIVDTGEKLDGLYDRDYLAVKDKYSAFIGGNNGHVRIYPADGSPLESERETLVLIKDSFGHSLAPFLAAHFDLEIIDLRYYKLPAIDFVKETGADRVLILYNMDSLLTTNSLAMLNLGLN